MRVEVGGGLTIPSLPDRGDEGPAAADDDDDVAFALAHALITVGKVSCILHIDTLVVKRGCRPSWVLASTLAVIHAFPSKG